MQIRAAELDDIEPLARLWFEGWQDAHAKIVPAELARFRTLDRFRERIGSSLADVRVSGDPGAPSGFHWVKSDELYQFYVAGHARGSGVASSLLFDAEDRLRAHGVCKAWLACAIGNERAARFYEKNGWQRVGTMINPLPTPDGVVQLEVWRYEKDLHELPARPEVSVAHVVLYTDRMEASARFMRLIGMRPIFDGPSVSVYELRGGTHLILMHKDAVDGGDAAFDLMVDDLRATHARFRSLGLAPSAIESRAAIGHEIFTVREPAGHVITFFSSHSSGKPV